MLHSLFNQSLTNVQPGLGKKILFACVPADGHFNPLTGIAMHLVSLGYEVHWYTSASYQPRLEKLGISLHPFQKALDVTGENIDQIFPERVGIHNGIKKLNFDLQHFFILRSTEYLADIQNIYESFPFDLLIADCVFTGIPFVKEKMNVPVISIGIVPVFESSKDLAPSGLGLTPAQNIFTRLKHKVLRVISDQVLFRSTNEILHRILREHGIDNAGMNAFDVLVRKADLVLQSGTPGFEYQRSDLGKNIRFIGPLLPYTRKTDKQPWFDNRLNQYRKVILVTQGTVEKNPEKIIVPVLEAYKDSDVLVIATTGGSQTQQLKERFPHSNIIVEDFIRFDDVMPYADVYVTNGGYGGVLLGIENQLPLVVAGLHEGKNEINARIGFFRLGINLKTETPTPAAMRTAVDSVLADATYKANVAKLAAEFKQFAPLELCAQYVSEVLNPATPKLRTVYRRPAATCKQVINL